MNVDKSSAIVKIIICIVKKYLCIIRAVCLGYVSGCGAQQIKLGLWVFQLTILLLGKSNVCII